MKEIYRVLREHASGEMDLARVLVADESWKISLWESFLSSYLNAAGMEV